MMTRCPARRASTLGKARSIAPLRLAVRAVVGAIFGVILPVTLPWRDYTGERLNADLFRLMDEGLAELENGLRL